MKERIDPAIEADLIRGAFYLLLFVTQVISHASAQETNNKEAIIRAHPPSNCAWTSAAMFPIPIMDEAVVTLGANIHTFGGISEGKAVPNAYKFDGTTWTPIAPYPSACGVESPSAVTDGNIHLHHEWKHILSSGVFD